LEAALQGEWQRLDTGNKLEQQTGNQPDGVVVTGVSRKGRDCFVKNRSVGSYWLTERLFQQKQSGSLREFPSQTL